MHIAIAQNKFRVDRARLPRVPCGMNAIVYVGDNFNSARKVFDNTQTKRDAWGKHNDAYGLVLSRWDGKQYNIVAMRDVI
jgi:hypothetical protein